MPLFDEDRNVLDTSSFWRHSTEELQKSGIIPNVPGLFGDGPPPNAIFLSHAHLDHTGLLNRSQESIPVYASRGTSKMMLAGSLFARQVELPKERFREIEPEKPVRIGDFTITGYSVDHSIYGCLAYLIEADGKSVLYTGDLRFHGRKPGMIRRFIEVFQEKTIDAMLMEGTHFGFPDGNLDDEYELEAEITKLVKDCESLVLASLSPQHESRLVSFIRAAKKTGRTFVADVYTAFIMHLLQNELPLPQPEPDGLVRVYVPQALRESNPRSGKAKQIERFLDSEITMTEICNQPDQFLMVFRASMLDDFGDQFPGAARCLYSRWHGYLEQPEWETVREKLKSVNGDLYEVHTSGHMLSADIVCLIEKMNPKTIIPVHTFEPEQFKKHFDNVVQIQDGVEYEIS
ncbi:Ribonuclease J 1 [Gimesia panareensis]|uniref:Ribonuclease J 1 n=1 Tax=Gimesia panareensis TaxID=2527978 RepID=A0A517QE55_9PLAN|nr:MBL fold metallo-hydrolase [Gimesia panareensis]QDT29909.1 Ribonuclease J 1 [Gimesia panareensis]